ncbi:MAG TPA: aminoglycoside phosphotransferase family protein [Acidimicrobiales bacterium]|nr:aminoglycoside phosphotransferase family protein [Acidimicrobiales bacterium]
MTRRPRGEIRIPASLAESAQREGRLAWLDALPALLSETAGRLGLVLGEPYEPGGRTAWVAPGRTAAGDDVVVKVGWRHPEARDEADGLRLAGGGGTVRLLSEESRGESTVLLLERCVPGTALSERPEAEQDAVVAGLLRRLWRAPPGGGSFRPLESMCRQWTEEYAARPAQERSPVDPGLAREGIALFGSLSRPGPDDVLLHTDLHAGNVLAATREPWLAIDPKPYVGDRTYDVLQHLLNCPRRLASDPLGLVGRMADLAELDAERLRLWLFARCIQQSPGWPFLVPVARRLAPR